MMRIKPMGTSWEIVLKWIPQNIGLDNGLVLSGNKPLTQISVAKRVKMQHCSFLLQHNSMNAITVYLCFLP